MRRQLQAVYPWRYFGFQLYVLRVFEVILGVAYDFVELRLQRARSRILGNLSGRNGKRDRRRRRHLRVVRRQAAGGRRLR